MLLGGVPPADRLRASRSELVGEILEALVARVEHYGQFPQEVLDVDIRGVIRENLALFESGLRGLPLDEQQLARIALSAHRRAEEGIPLELVLSAYFVSAATAWSSVTAAAEADDVEALRHLTVDVLAHLDQVFSALTTAYVEELRASDGQVVSDRAALLSALVDGGPTSPEEVATAAGLTIAEHYLVLDVSILSPVTAEAPPGVSATAATVVVRRRQRTIRTLLERAPRHEPLLRLRDDGGLLLLPHGDGPRDWTESAVDQLVGELAAALGHPVRATVALSAAGSADHAARLVEELSELAARLDLAPGVHRLDDLLLPYQLSRPGPATEALAARLAPIADREDLMQTLRVHLAEELSRSRTSTRLSVHPNTLDYRLGRIRDLTGLDAGTPSHLALLRAALLAHDVADPAASPGGDPATLES